MRNLLLAAISTLLIVSCNTQPDNPNVTEEAAKTDVEQMKKEVLAIHDTAMKKMTTMSGLQKDLKEAWATEVDSLPYMQAYQGLQTAREDMMAWMHSFQMDENATKEEMRNYLLEEKKSIEAVNAEMDKVINEARFLLGGTGTETSDGDMDHSDHNHDDHSHDDHSH